MRLSRSLLAAALFSGAAVIGLAAPAIAAPPTSGPSAGTSMDQLVGVVHQTGPTTATVMARYTCRAPQAHLWVSVKQTADRTADPRLAMEGSSADSAAWSQTHSGVLICDGRNHVSTVTVDQAEQGFGTLAKGEAWVQFCLFDATTGGDAGPGGTPISDSQFMHVR